MKSKLLYLSLLLIFAGCLSNQLRIDADHPNLKKIKGIVLFNEKPFTGTLFSTYSNGTNKYEQELSDGRKDGIETLWYPNKQVRSVSEFSGGMLNGIQKEWHQNGKPSREMSFENGKQSGLQIGWEEDGDLRFKYTYQKGKRYGFMGSALCQAPE